MLIEALKMIRDAEREAEKIIDEAKFQAARIKQKTDDELMEIYRATYKENLAEATKRSEKLIKDSRAKAEHELKNIPISFETQIEKIQEKARRNIGSAVEFVFNEVTS